MCAQTQTERFNTNTISKPLTCMYIFRSHKTKEMDYFYWLHIQYKSHSAVQVQSYCPNRTHQGAGKALTFNNTVQYGFGNGPCGGTRCDH